eukprot:m.58035 g.58035  ORF g.58035 m.58035 type:complete len:314 (+) comp13509_c0_seq2:378-1319(+)
MLPMQYVPKPSRSAAAANTSQPPRCASLVLVAMLQTRLLAACRGAVSARAAAAVTVRHMHAERLYWEEKGSGPAVLCMPGALGTGRTDFGPQLDGLSKKYRVIAVDPLGYGQSRPPARSFSLDFYQDDADRAADLMDSLNVKEYSVIGWSDGANSSVLLAASRPKEVKRLVIFGGNAFVDQQDLALYAKTADTSKWSPSMQASLGAVYGCDLQRIWKEWNDCMIEFVQKRKGDICQQQLASVKCPTLILHGEKDPMVPAHHPQNLHKNIAGSKLLLFPQGKHNIHIKYAEEFNAIADAFFSNPHGPLPTPPQK